MVNMFIDILEMSIPVSVLILLLLAVSPLLKRTYVSKWRYYMWLFVAVRLLIPVRLGIKSAVTVSVPQSIAPLHDTTSAASISPVTILAAIWIFGIAALAVYRVICYITFNRLIKRWQSEITDEDILREFRAAKDFAGVKHDIKIVRCKAVTTPMVFGLIKPVILMPDIEFSKSELAIVLKHELVHLRRNDILYKLIITIACTVYWFNPLMYLMMRAANRDLELACDAEVVRNKDGEYRRRYCEAIMRLVHNRRGAGTVLSTCFIFSKKTVMERFKYIIDEKIKRNGVIMFCVVAFSVVLSGGMVSFATEQVAEKLEDDLQIIERESESPAQTAASEANQATVPVRERNTGNDVSDNNGYAYSEETYTQPVYTEPEAVEPESETEQQPETLEIDEISARITGDAEVSPDGSRVTYDLDDGSRAVIQYDGGTIDSGYILVN
ncbi:MAG: M56 family metallopeptidase [Clostridia bacterium]|nr:M56 family metallopeptidase [Clostridia bacterium]